tara:strand:+ start:7853 stop:10024 length:2172 start_codon:yes stop_codon:yes gene_type:complete
MARVTTVLSNFRAGELTPKLEGRTDLDFYQEGSKEITNMIVDTTGGLTRRAGTTYIANTKSDGEARLIPFVFSEEQAYILEFGNDYLRVYKDKAQVTDSGSAVEVATPYETSDLADINFTQSADVLYISHPNYHPRKLTRTSHTAWTLTKIAFEHGPYLDENTTATTITSNATTGNVTLTASASTFVSNHVGSIWELRQQIASEIDLWEANKSVSTNNLRRYEGNVYKATGGGTTGTRPPVHTEGTESDGTVNWAFQHDGQGYVEITGYTSATVVSATVKSQLPDSVTSGTKFWSEGAWSDHRGYPRAIGFFEERIYYAGTSYQPQTIWGSTTADFENFKSGSEDDSSVAFTIASDQVNAIRHLLPEQVLAMFTQGGEFVLQATGTSSSTVTPTNVQVARQTAYGAANIRPIRAGNVSLFVQSGGKKVREFSYQAEVEGYVGVDLTIRGEHLMSGKIKEMGYQQEPRDLVWIVTQDGNLRTLTYDRQNNLVALAQHPMTGTNVAVESVAVIPNSNTETEDQVWFVVKRTINSATKRHVVCLNTFDFGTDIADAKYLDSMITYSGGSTSTITGLGHLEGETVSVLVNGASHADKTVSSGQITLDRATTKAQVGLSYVSTIQSMPLETQAELGSAVSRDKRINRVFVRFYETVGAEVGYDSDNLDRIPFRDSSMQMDKPVPLFTGDKDVVFPRGWDRQQTIYVRQNQPLPMTVLNIVAQITTNDF